MKPASKKYIPIFLRPIIKNTPNFSDYTYNCVDQSLLLEPVKKYYLTYWHHLIPTFVTANIITIVASALMWLNCFFVLWFSDRYSVGILGVFSALCVHLYVVGDNLDGMRAKASGTSAPLGEFLDHYLDTYNIALSVIIAAYLIPVEENYLVFPIIFLTIMSFVFTMADQKVTRQLFFGRINSLEMSTLLTLFYLLLVIPPFAQFWSVELMGNIKVYVPLVVISGMLQLPVIFTAAKRMKRIPSNLHIFALSFFGVLLLALSGAGRIIGAAILTFYGAEYVGRIILSHVGNLPFPPPRYTNILIIAVVAVFRFAPTYAAYQFWIFLALAIYLIFMAVIAFIHAFWLMRHFWIWKNPSYANPPSKINI